MKNYNFERDLARKIEKMKHILEVCTLYEVTRSISEVSKRLGMSRNTVSKVVSEYFLIENGCSYVNFNLSAECPKMESENED